MDSHDNVLLGLHVLQDHVGHALHLARIDGNVTREDSGNVQNAKVRARRPRKLDFQNLRGEVLLVRATALGNAHVLVRDLTHDVQEPLGAQVLPDLEVVLVRSRCRVPEPFDLNVGLNNGDLEPVWGASRGAPGHDPCRESRAAAAVGGERNARQALKQRRLSSRLAATDDKLEVRLATIAVV